jgi:hypothetical protein
LLDRADGQKQKHVKRASKEMRFSRTVDALFHYHRVPGEQPVLLEARQRCRDLSLSMHTATTESGSLFARMKS